MAIFQAFRQRGGLHQIKLRGGCGWRTCRIADNLNEGLNDLAMMNGEICHVPMLCEGIPTWATISQATQNCSAGDVEFYKKQINILKDTLNDLTEINIILKSQLHVIETQYTNEFNTTEYLKPTTTNSWSNGVTSASTVRETSVDSFAFFTNETEAITNLLNGTREMTHEETTIDTMTVSPSDSSTTVPDDTEAITTSQNNRFEETTYEVATTDTTTGKGSHPRFYNGKEFTLIASKFMPKSEARDRCEQEYGGHLANIYDQTYMERIMFYIRKVNMKTETSKDFHLGMTYDPSGRQLYFRNNTPVSETNYKWLVGTPKTGPSDTQMYLRVLSNESDHDNQYLFNDIDERARAICESDIETTTLFP